MTLRVGSTALLSLLLAISAICMPQSQDSAKPASGKTAASKPADNEDPPESQKMEAGKYMVLSEDGIGPFIPAVFGFTESWTLWRLKDGSYEEKGERGYRSPSAETHQESFATHLAPDFHVLSIQYFGLLRWRPDAGPITCDFLPNQLSCVSSAKDQRNGVRLDLPMHEAYGFVWPISTLSLGGITRGAIRDRHKMTGVELVQVEEASASDPVAATVLEGHLKYLGQEKIEIARRQWTADKFELQVPLYAPLLLWTSPEGLLLAAGTASKGKAQPGNGLVLTEFQRWHEP